MNTKNNELLTVEKLKQLGRYEIEHYRKSSVKNALLPLKYFKMNNVQTTIMPKGGLTILTLRLHDGTRYFATADCRDTDSFRRSLGVGICLKRIQEQMAEHVRKFNEVPF